MLYIKIMDDNTIISAEAHVTPIYICRQATNGILIRCPEIHAQGILSLDGSTVYQLDGKESLQDDAEYTAYEITLPEYEAIMEELDPHYDPDPEPPYDDTLERLIAEKVAEMSATCNALIEGGVDVVLSDGETYHFSLTTQDQLNLTTLDVMARGGENQIPYHADGELCKFYTAEDIERIIQAAKEWTSYHITYFNSLQCYIKALTSIEAVGDIVYGVPVPEEYQSEVYKAIINALNIGEGEDDYDDEHDDYDDEEDDELDDEYDENDDAE